MKVLCIASASFRGGATISLINTLLGLKKKGVEIFLITPEEGYLCDIMRDNGISYDIVSLNFTVWPKVDSLGGLIKLPYRLLRLILKRISSIRKVKAIAKSWNPDIIHTNVSVIDIGYKAAKKLGLPHVWHIREYGDKDFDLKLFPSKRSYSTLFKDSYTIAITKDLQKYYGLRGEKSIVIYNGIEELSPIEIKDLKKENKILYVGRLEKNKGVTDIVKSFIKFLEISNDYTLELIGSCDDTYRRELDKLIIAGKADKYIKIVGPQTDIYSRMQKAKALIVASRCEGFGRITAEAMINGCLVIGRNTGGTKEQFDNGKELIGKEIGLRYNDSDELLNQLKSLISLDEDIYTSVLENALKVARELYRVEKNVDITYNYIEKIIRTNN